MDNPINVANLRPVQYRGLVRLGGRNDGGYVVPLDVVKQADSLLSFGVYFDWEFERAFRKHNSSCLIHCYDHNTSLARAMRHSLTNLAMSISDPSKQRFRSICTFIDYALFFRGANVHFQQRIWRDRNRNSATVADAFARLNSGQHVFLKMDIEGSEYRILDDILQHASTIDAMVVEFHDLDLLQGLFNRAMEKILDRFHVVHIHGNNYADMTEHRFPSVIEMTFVNRRLFAQNPLPAQSSFPVHGLDAPNDPSAPQVKFEF